MLSGALCITMADENGRPSDINAVQQLQPMT